MYRFISLFLLLFLAMTTPSSAQEGPRVASQVQDPWLAEMTTKLSDATKFLKSLLKPSDRPLIVACKGIWVDAEKKHELPVGPCANHVALGIYEIHKALEDCERIERYARALAKPTPDPEIPQGKMSWIIRNEGPYCLQAAKDFGQEEKPH